MEFCEVAFNAMLRAFIVVDGVPFEPHCDQCGESTRLVDEKWKGWEAFFRRLGKTRENCYRSRVGWRNSFLWVLALRDRGKIVDEVPELRTMCLNTIRVHSIDLIKEA